MQAWAEVAPRMRTCLLQVAALQRAAIKCTLCVEFEYWVCNHDPALSTAVQGA